MRLEQINSQSGLVLILSIMWMFTLIIILGFGIWVLKAGIEPQSPIVTSLLGVLIGTAFGSVNGALFSQMTGESKGTGTTSTTTTTTIPPMTSNQKDSNISSVKTQVNTEVLPEQPQKLQTQQKQQIIPRSSDTSNLL